MNKQIKLFTLILSLFATVSAFAQGAGKVSVHDITFSATTLDEWTVKKLPATATTGRYVIATSKTDRSQVAVELREGKIAQVSFNQSGLGTFKALEPASAPCSTIHCAANQLSHCFQTPSGCVCICGSWITLYPGN